MVRISLVTAAVVVFAVTAVAQSDVASNTLSQGIHALHSGRTSEATRLLDTATALQPRDPRGYYFHSIALRRQGRSGEADAMLEQGAMVEAQFSGSRFAIDQSLERIQGATRLKIEAARRDARAAYAESRQTRQAARVAARDARQALVQRQPGRVPLEAFTRPVSLDQARVIAADHSDPFADDAAEVVIASTTPADVDTSSFFEPSETPIEMPVDNDEGNPFADSGNPFDAADGPGPADFADAEVTEVPADFAAVAGPGPGGPQQGGAIGGMVGAVSYALGSRADSTTLGTLVDLLTGGVDAPMPGFGGGPPAGAFGGGDFEMMEGGGEFGDFEMMEGEGEFGDFEMTEGDGDFEGFEGFEDHSEGGAFEFGGAEMNAENAMEAAPPNRAVPMSRGSGAFAPGRELLRQPTTAGRNESNDNGEN